MNSSAVSPLAAVPTSAKPFSVLDPWAHGQSAANLAGTHASGNKHNGATKAGANMRPPDLRQRKGRFDPTTSMEGVLSTWAYMPQPWVKELTHRTSPHLRCAHQYEGECGVERLTRAPSQPASKQASKQTPCTKVY
jgi:hypothetical protein